jgi:V/A-type H+-transporting ATPase subunit C
MARRGDSTRYGFAVGRVMVLRTRLLGHAAYERLIDAPTFADQRRVLSETHFGRFVEHVATAADVELAVDESLRDLYEEFLERAGLPEPVVAYFRVPYDFSALKGALKAKALGVSAERGPIGLGTLPPEAFDSPTTLPEPLGETARSLLAAEGLDVEAVDIAVDRVMFAHMLHLAKESKVDYLVKLATREIDVANAKVLLRTAIARRSPEDAARMLITGGAWNAASLTGLVRRPEELAAALAEARILGVSAPAELLDLERIDPLADQAIARLAREAARMPIGPEPVLGYVLSRRAEAITVRSLLVGRLAGLPRDVVASRLREVAS